MMRACVLVCDSTGRGVVLTQLGSTSHAIMHSRCVMPVCVENKLAQPSVIWLSGGFWLAKSCPGLA